MATLSAALLQGMEKNVPRSKRKLQKHLRSAGLAYISRTGKLIPAKKVAGKHSVSWKFEENFPSCLQCVIWQSYVTGLNHYLLFFFISSGAIEFSLGNLNKVRLFLMRDRFACFFDGPLDRVKSRSLDLLGENIGLVNLCTCTRLGRKKNATLRKFSTGTRRKYRKVGP